MVQRHQKGDASQSETQSGSCDRQLPPTRSLGAKPQSCRKPADGGDEDAALDDRHLAVSVDVPIPIAEVLVRTVPREDQKDNHDDHAADDSRSLRRRLVGPPPAIEAATGPGTDGV